VCRDVEGGVLDAGCDAESADVGFVVGEDLELG
jgi:hypothetical protein